MSDTLISSIRERYQHTLAQIGEAAAGSGRAAHAVNLVVVSKTQPVEIIQAAIAAGIYAFGENYPEEAVQKIAALKENAVEWHMIGHVQSRKADLVAANFTMLHSLDSLKLAGRLDRFCGELNRTLPVLLEFNVSGEESKFGFPAWEERNWPDLVPDVEQILVLRRLRRLQEFLVKRFPQADWLELSMGTSVDFIAAVQEGATFVRIGQAILGPRSK